MALEYAVAILLCTFNGEAHLAEQLATLNQQSIPGRLYISDDGSRDGTVELLERQLALLPLEAAVRPGPGLGHSANFLSLVCDPGIEADYFAYADQDDLWEEHKLERALRSLNAVPANEPALYCGRTRTISERGEHLGYSPLFGKQPSFRNALVHNIGGGNTMVFNNAARRLLLRAGVVDVVSHDWWTYLLVSGAGGQVIYDPEPLVSYRQHPGNEIGANHSLADRLHRYGKALGGRNRAWTDRNLQALSDCRDLLTAENRKVLETFCASRDAGLRGRLAGLRKTGLYAQTFSGNLGLLLATLLKKI